MQLITCQLFFNFHDRLQLHQFLLRHRIWYCFDKYFTRAPEFTTGFFLVGSVDAHLFSSFVLYYYVSYVLHSVLWCMLRFHTDTMFGSSLPSVVCRRDHFPLFSLMKFPSGHKLMIWVYMNEHVMPFDHSDEVRLSLYTMDIECVFQSTDKQYCHGGFVFAFSCL
jgi:hypothetical protein